MRCMLKMIGANIIVFLFTGDAGYDRVRPLSYNDADLVIICFSVGDPESMENVVSKVVITFHVDDYMDSCLDSLLPH